MYVAKGVHVELYRQEQQYCEVRTVWSTVQILFEKGATSDYIHGATTTLATAVSFCE